MSDLQGHRVPDGDFPIEPGDYSKFSVTDGVVAWMVCAPNGCRFVLANTLSPDPYGRVHEVEEHEDGTITVEPKPHNSNSIGAPPHRGVGWHGYIYRGVWRAV